jgi:hypothetical protein
MSAHAILKRDLELDFDQRCTCTKEESEDKTGFFGFPVKMKFSISEAILYFYFQLLLF